MTHWPHAVIESACFQAVLWTVAAPAVLVALVLSSAALLLRYARLVEGVPETDRFLPKAWITKHRRLCLRSVFACYFFLILSSRPLGWIADTIFAALILCYALFMAGWAVRRLASGRSVDAPVRTYCIGLLVGALLLTLVAGFFYELRSA